MTNDKRKKLCESSGGADQLQLSGVGLLYFRETGESSIHHRSRQSQTLKHKKLPANYLTEENPILEM